MSTSNMPDGWQKEFGPDYIPYFQQVPLCDFDKLFSGDTGTKEKNTIDIDHFIKNVCKPHSIKDDVALAFAMDENGNINEKIFRSTLENAKLDEYKKAPNTNTLCQHEINTYYDKQVKQYPNAITDFNRAEALRNELDIKFAEKGEQVPMGFKNDGFTRFTGTVEYKTADRDQYYVDPTETKILSRNQYYELLKDEHGNVTNDSLIKFYNTYDLRKPGSLEHLKEVLMEMQKGKQNNKDEYIIAPKIDINDPKKPLENDPNSPLKEPLEEQPKEYPGSDDSDPQIDNKAEALRNELDIKFAEKGEQVPMGFKNDGFTRFTGTVEYKTADRDQYYVDPTETKFFSQNQYYELLKDEHGNVTNDSLIKFYNTYDLRKPESLEHLKEVLMETQKGEQNNKDEYIIAPKIDVNDPKKPSENDPNSPLKEPLEEQPKEYPGSDDSDSRREQMHSSEKFLPEQVEKFEKQIEQMHRGEEYAQEQMKEVEKQMEEIGNRPENDVNAPSAPSVNNGIVDQEPAHMNNGPANGNTNTMAGPDNQVS